MRQSNKDAESFFLGTRRVLHRRRRAVRRTFWARAGQYTFLAMAHHSTVCGVI
jgi:hypothetical protein